MPTKTPVKPAKKQAKEVPPVQSRDDLGEGGFAPYPATLVEGSQVKADNGNWQTLLLFDVLSKEYQDGNPVKQYVRVTNWFAKSGEAAGPGSEADIVSQSFLDQSSDDFNIFSDDSIAEYIGHSFMLQDEATGRTYTSSKDGKERNAYVTTCVEYLGEDFAFEGVIKVVQGAASSNGSGPSFDPAAYLADLLNGEEIEELRGGKALELVKGDTKLAEVKQILDKPTRGGLVKPRAVLIDRLIEEGYAEDIDGVFSVMTNSTR